MAAKSQRPVALTIAGSDSGGGAGIQADLKTFAALGVHGTSAITAVTAQNPRTVRSIYPVPATMVRDQIRSVFAELYPAACKTGMLYSAETIRMLVRFFRRRPVPLIIDPVMIATSGSRLLKPEALVEYRKLFRLALLITPNLMEAEAITGKTIRSEEDMRAAAKSIYGRFGCSALVKGGHLHGSKSAVDIFFDGRKELLLMAPFIKGAATHGTGCTYSAAITAYLALGLALPVSVERAKEYVTQSIANRWRVHGHHVLDSSGSR